MNEASEPSSDHVTVAMVARGPLDASSLNGRGTSKCPKLDKKSIDAWAGKCSKVSGQVVLPLMVRLTASNAKRWSMG